MLNILKGNYKHTTKYIEKNSNVFKIMREIAQYLNQYNKQHTKITKDTKKNSFFVKVKVNLKIIIQYIFLEFLVTWVHQEHLWIVHKKTDLKI